VTSSREEERNSRTEKKARADAEGVKGKREAEGTSRLEAESAMLADASLRRLGQRRTITIHDG
jgi:hypothetical protein